MMRKDYNSPLCRNVARILWANPLANVEDYITKVSRGEDSALKQTLAEEFPQNPSEAQQAICYSFLVNNNNKFSYIKLKYEFEDANRRCFENRRLSNKRVVKVPGVCRV